MTSGKRLFACMGLLVLGGAVLSVAASAAGGSARSPAAAKPVIGQPVTAPAQAMAGKPFAVSFKVTRSDNGKPVTAGRMICDPTSAGKLIAHTESFIGGKARLAFVVPTTATQVRVKVTIKAGAGSATKISTFAVKQAVKPAISIAGATVTEGSAGTSTLTFPVTLSAASPQQVTVAYATADGTATAPTDYTTANGTLTFKAGEKAKTVSVSVVGDTLVEADETLTVTLSGAVNATVATSSATGTITNDDVAPKSGHYAGTTSQGKPFGFDVASDLRTITNLTIVADLRCVEAPIILGNFGLRMTGSVPIASDWSFNAAATHAEADSTVEVGVSGKLAAPGTASGTLHVNFSLNLDDGSVAHCNSGDLTWTAS